MTDDTPHSESGEIGTDYELQQLRLLFFRALDKFCPAARDELHKLWVACREDFEHVKQKIRQVDASQANEVDNSLARSGLQMYDPDPRVSILLPLLDHRRGYLVDSKINEINAKVDKWALDIGMKCDWVLDAACRMLAAWDDCPDQDYKAVPWIVPAKKFDEVGIVTPLSSGVDRFEFTMDHAWNPIFESMPDAKARVEARFNAFTKVWFEERKTIAEQNGWQEISTRHRDATDHLEWLIRHRMCNMQVRIIRERHVSDGRSRSAIGHAIERISDTLGLPSIS